MNDLNDIELHDANLVGIDLNQITRTLIIDISHYPSGGSGERVKATLTFTGVARLNQIMDLELMQNHSSFGNIGYWVTGETPGVTYIYLARGLICITSETVEFVSGV